MFEAIWSYDVEVTVTNVGDKPFDKVWIFLFPYVDGKLEFSTWSHTKSVESLYIGESYSYTFTVLSEKMTTYKILVIGG